MWSVLKNYSDGALLFLRITLGSWFLYLHGFPLLAGGRGEWRRTGAEMHHLGITMGETFWGFLAACSESLGCALFIIGFAFRPSCLTLFLTLAVMAFAKYHTSLAIADYSLSMALVFFTLMFVGPGKFSFDKG
ncbi:MAG TPA: DoxX family protein [Chthoniobacteraceae bacterium]|jgi:putative oxidoreductase|nr:DoxX family protein [Chthoniobacteraceae bacterium]